MENNFGEMAGPSSSDIRNEISNILEGADLASLSSKKVRKLLEKTFETELSSRKKEIDKVLMELLAKKEKSDEVDEENTETDITPDDKDIPQKEDSDGAQSDSSFESPEDMDPPVPKAKKPTETSSSSHEKIDDEELARRLQEEDMGRRTRHSSQKKTHKKAKKSKTAERSKKGVKTGYNSDMVLSPELAEIMGTDKMSRAEVVKRMWQIVKERQLADPKNKQYHICDDQLLKVFGTKRVRTFSMMKYLKRHIKDPELLSDAQ